MSICTLCSTLSRNIQHQSILLENYLSAHANLFASLSSAWQIRDKARILDLNKDLQAYLKLLMETNTLSQDPNVHIHNKPGVAKLEDQFLALSKSNQKVHRTMIDRLKRKSQRDISAQRFLSTDNVSCISVPFSPSLTTSVFRTCDAALPLFQLCICAACACTKLSTCTVIVDYYWIQRAMSGCLAFEFELLVIWFWAAP
jgi:hypothetical protein